MKTSYRVIELVRAKISNEHLTASDTDISRVLGLSRANISAYKHEKIVMSVETLAKAQEVLQLPQQEYFDLMLTLTAEGTSDPLLHDTWVKLHRLVRGALKDSRRIAGCLAPAIVAVGMTFAVPGNQASAASFDSSQVYIIRSSVMGLGATSVRDRSRHTVSGIPPGPP